MLFVLAALYMISGVFSRLNYASGGAQLCRPLRRKRSPDIDEKFEARNATRGSEIPGCHRRRRHAQGQGSPGRAHERNFPAGDIRLLDDEEALGQLEAVNDEPTFIQSVLPEHLNGVDFTFFAAEEAYTAKTWEMARRAGCEIIDLSYALENHTEAVVRAPWVEQELGEGHPVDWHGAGGDCTSGGGGAGLAAGAAAQALTGFAAHRRHLEPASETGAAAWTSSTSRP